MHYLNYLREKTDPFNEQGLRNVNNTDVDEYNCLSYALGTYAWTRPYEKYEDRLDEVVSMIMDDDMTYEECANFLLEKDTQWLLDNAPDKVRLVHDESELNEDECLIAFREYAGRDIWGDIDTDFHATIKLDGEWYEKCGAHSPKKTDEMSMWQNDSGYFYNSDTAYFAIKK